MQRMMGLPRSEAREMVYRAWPPHVPVQPLPQGAPRRITPADVGIVDADPLTIVVIGDHGGVKDPAPQRAVAMAIQREAPQFCLSLGDVVYFNGDASEYVPQFYEPYDSCRFPILAIPGNHDGDTTDDRHRPPLDTWLANFCSAEPQAPPADPQLEYGRHTQTLPWCDWSLVCKTVTIIGLYSNVPSGGHLERRQVDWLAEEVAAAPADRPLIVCLHHPPYCCCEATEVLTPDGWRCHDQIAPGSVVMTLNHETGLSEWQPCSAVNRFEVLDEPMVSVEGNAHSSLTTLEHRWPVMCQRHPARDEYEFVRDWTTSEGLRSTHHLVTGAPCGDVPVEATFTDDFVEAVAWFYTEGSIARRYVSAQATIVQSQRANPEKVARIRRVLTGLYGDASTERMSYGRSGMLVEPAWREYEEEQSEKVSFWLNTPATAELLEVAPDKVVSLDFIKALTASQLDLFIETSLAADGHGDTLAQNDERRLEAFEMACILAGRTPHSYADRTKRALKDGSIAKLMKLVHASKRMRLRIPSPSQSSRSSHPRRTTYTGTVWCPTTKNGTWLARRNGTVFYTGNSADAHHGGSQKMGNALDRAFAVTRFPEFVLAGHVHNYQRFTRRGELIANKVTYMVLGNSGYHNLHALARGAAPGVELMPGLTFEGGDDDEFGYVRLTVDSHAGISGQYVGVTPGATANEGPMITPRKDVF